MPIHDHSQATSVGEGDLLLQRRRATLCERLPGLEGELAELFDDVGDMDMAVLCADDEDVVLFLQTGSAMVEDVFGSGLWVGMRWRPPEGRDGQAFCHAEPVLAPDRRRAATLAILTRSPDAAPFARVLARRAARNLAYRACVEQMARRAPVAAAIADGPEVIAHRGRLAVAERVAAGDPGVQHSLELAQRLAGRNIPILLNGETGTGKEVFARAVHALSHRYVGRFVAVNCASVPESLIESELFGYAGGAFTGASRGGYRGRILQADGGVLFLDEIGDMPFALQARLLRVLETREVTPLGAEEAVGVDIQIVSATHRDLEQSVRAGVFREDLYYRLCGMRITLPPLRERHDRRTLLAAVLDEESRGRAVFDPAALDALDRYPWPGNLREMRNAVRVAMALAEDFVVRLEHLPAAVSGRLPARKPAPEAGGDGRAALIAEIDRQRWNISAVARRLGISRNTLYRRMRRLSIAIPRDHNP